MLNSQLTAKFSPSSTISHASYENDLLQKRNLLLSKENQQLLNKVEELQIQISNTKGVFDEKIDSFLNKERESIASIVKNYLPQIQDKISDLKLDALIPKLSMIEQLNENKTSPKCLVKCLFQLMSDFLKEKQKKKSSSNLEKVAQLLNKRKSQQSQIKDLKAQTVHFIKEPPTSREPLHKVIQPMNFFYRNLVRAVKRESVRGEFLNKIFQEISEYVDKRQRYHISCLEMSKLERQWELGMCSEGNLQEFSASITEERDSLQQRKEQILKNIVTLK